MTAHATSNLPVIWITGASSGIGKAFAQQYAKDGAHLILSSRQVDELEKLKSELTSFSNGDIFVHAIRSFCRRWILQEKNRTKRGHGRIRWMY